MSYHEFSSHGYQIIRELGHNSLGGRITYLAKRTSPTSPVHDGPANDGPENYVVIKLFQFAKLGATWAEYDSYEQEIKVLKSLNHPGIPLYLDSFPTDDGFCMIQEYINAESAAIFRTFSPEDIKQIALSALEILVYLQSQQPPVIHRDIKPENLLIDENNAVYLVDFGFARMGGGEIAASSVVKGTMGFMPPEQLFNRQLTCASDLYGLGASLICLLTGTKSADIGNLIDANYYLKFRHLVPPQSRSWINWLETMVEPNTQHRYQSALVALKTLENLHVTRLPKVRLSQNKIKPIATELGQKIKGHITISNPIPETILAGRWEVLPHRSDPPHTPYDHAWISFHPYKFEGNDISCEICVDTSKLLADKIYRRQLLLSTNSDPETYTIDLEIKTAKLPIIQQPKYSSKEFLFSVILIIFGIISGIILSFIGYPALILGVPFVTIILTAFVVVERIMRGEVKEIDIGSPLDYIAKGVFITLSWVLNVNFLTVYFKIDKTEMQNDNDYYLIILIVFYVVSLLASLAKYSRINIIISGVSWLLSMIFLTKEIHFIFAIFYLISGLAIMGIATKISYKIAHLLQGTINWEVRRGFLREDAISIVFLMSGFCISLGAIGNLFFKGRYQVEFIQLGELLALGGASITCLSITAVPLINLLVFKPKKIITKYHKIKSSLIKP